MTSLAPLEASAADYGDDEREMARYRAEGTERALALGNRGPIRFDAQGRLDAAIIESYVEHGFYVFEGVLDAAELDDIEADLADLFARAPVTKGAETDRRGRPVDELLAKNVSWARPLSDPLGGTSAANGRHPAKMNEPTAPVDAPEFVVQVISGSLQFSEAALRVYGHPDLLGVAASINGDDFTPFNEVLFVKEAGLGGSVAWHQDAWTHWDSPDLDATTHGFNFMAQVFGCDAVNGLWVVPGSQLMKHDIAAMVDAAGSDRLPDAVPMICAPGDVAINNRQVIHASFANTGTRPRVTVNFGFHRRSSVIDVESGGVHNSVTRYDEAYIAERSKVIGWAIDARAQRYPDERRFAYAPHVDREDEFRFGDDTMHELRGYNRRDIGI